MSEEKKIQDEMEDVETVQPEEEKLQRKRKTTVERLRKLRAKEATPGRNRKRTVQNRSLRLRSLVRKKKKKIKRISRLLI